MLLRASCRVAARSYVAAGVALMSLPAAAADEPVLKFTTDLKSDSIDRGITQTAHRPGVTSGVDLQKNWLYVTTEISSVKLPANPAAEVALGVGLRPTLPGFENVDIASASSAISIPEPLRSMPAAAEPIRKRKCRSASSWGGGRSAAKSRI